MPLVSSCAMLKNAQSTGRAIGAFNIENMEMAQAVIDAAVEANLQLSCKQHHLRCATRPLRFLQE